MLINRYICIMTKTQKTAIAIVFGIFVIVTGIILSIHHFDNKDNATSLYSKLKQGDIIFHTSQSTQSRAIQLATDSRYSHMGMIYKKGDKIYVFEAVQPVRLTPLSQWIKRGKDEHFVIKRLKHATKILTPGLKQKMKDLGTQHLGKDYDRFFEWSDEKMYCSEVVWKIYKKATGVEIGQLEKLKDFNISHPLVKKKLRERYGHKIPYDEKVISPTTIFQSKKLKTVLQN